MYGCSFRDRHPNLNYDAKKKAEEELARFLRNSKPTKSSEPYYVLDSFEDNKTRTVILCSGDKEVSTLNREIRKLKYGDKVLSQIEDWDKEPRANSYAVLLGAAKKGSRIRIFTALPEGWRIR